MNDIKNKYLNTLRDTLTGYSYGDAAALPYWPLRRALAWLFPNLRVGRRPKDVHNHAEWLMTAKTMTGREKLDVLRFCIENIINEKIAGSVVECGVWRGGSCIFAAGVLFANNDNRDIILCDSFEGLPPPTHELDCGTNWHHLGDYLGVSVEQVEDNFNRFGLIDQPVTFIKGWFKDTLPNWSRGHIAILRADGDTYESTRNILDNLYQHVSPGGIIIIDDWYLAECRQAVMDFLKEKSEAPYFVEFFKNKYNEYDSVFWSKS